ncbi:MAG: cysteine peptidase family C39 domain-containing protein [Nanoarchaeota archaeon]
MNIPWFEQELAHSCGAASIRMALGYFKIKISEKLICKISKLTLEGLSHREMIQAIQQFGLYAFVKRNATLQDLRTSLRAVLPIIVNYNHIPRRFPESGEGGHYAVVKRINNTHIILSDPVEGPEHKITIKEFKDNWFDHEEHSQQWIMMVSTKPIKILVKGKVYKPARNRWLRVKQTL